MSDTNLWGTSLPPIEEEKAPIEPEHSINPCIDRFGPGPAGQTCKDCVHLHGFQQSATWYKCTQRAWKTRGGKYPGTTYPGGDHRVRWPACARYEQESEASHE